MLSPFRTTDALWGINIITSLWFDARYVFDTPEMPTGELSRFTASRSEGMPFLDEDTTLVFAEDLKQIHTSAHEPCQALQDPQSR